MNDPRHTFPAALRPRPAAPVPAAPATAAGGCGNLDWAHKPSPLSWSVMIFGGQNPRDGFDQPKLEVRFHKRTRPNGYGLTRDGILWRANDFAKREHRTHFAVRDVDGSVIYCGPVLNEIEAPKVIGLLSDGELEVMAKRHRERRR